MQNNPLLNQLAFDIVKDKVIEDKTKAYMEEQEKKEKEEAQKQKVKGQITVIFLIEKIRRGIRIISRSIRYLQRRRNGRQ